jgi:hypothetical protein
MTKKHNDDELSRSLREVARTVTMGWKKIQGTAGEAGGGGNLKYTYEAWSGPLLKSNGGERERKWGCH